jgi:hypothetical protein
MKMVFRIPLRELLHLETKKSGLLFQPLTVFFKAIHGAEINSFTFELADNGIFLCHVNPADRVPMGHLSFRFFHGG